MASPDHSTGDKFKALHGFYKAAVCRNASINIATSLGTSDIPDWRMVEMGEDFKYDMLPTPSLMERMWKSSPLQYVDKIKTPIMLLIGKEDRRLSPNQSHELYKALKARNLPVRCIVYPDDSHPLKKMDSEADAFINIYKWFTKHVHQV